MTADDQPLNLTLQILAPREADDEEVFDRTRYLKSELEELRVDEANLVRTPALAGAKAGEAILIGTMAIAALPAILTPLFDLVRDWLARNRDIKIKAKIGDQEIEIEYPSALAPPIDVQQWLATALARHEAVPPISTQSGGVNVEDGQVSASGDVVGRDKIISIHAEAGATVIVGQPSSAANDQVTAEADEYQ